MLRSFVIGLGCFGTAGAVAQSWCPPGAMWTHDYADIIGGQYGITRVEYVSDTLLGGFMAQRLRETNVTAFAGTQDYIASSNSSIYTRFDDGIVYQWEASTSAFDTLMWFDAAPGQFWHAPLADNLNPSLRLMVVDTATVLVGSVPLRRLLIQMGNQQIDTLHERIGFSFLFPGVGYGGSCFPKDVRAVTAVAAQHGFETSILNAVDAVNERQKHVLFQKISKHFDGDLKGKRIAIWGLAFKPQTDDIREASSIELITRLLEAGAEVHVHDPVAMDNVKQVFGDRVTFHSHQYDTLEGAAALAIVTEWNEYRTPDFSYLQHKLAQPTIFDGRNLYEPARMKELGFYYSGIGIGER